MINRTDATRVARTVALAAGALYLTTAPIGGAPLVMPIDATCANTCPGGSTCALNDNHNNVPNCWLEGFPPECMFDTQNCC